MNSPYDNIIKLISCEQNEIETRKMYRGMGFFIKIINSTNAKFGITVNTKIDYDFYTPGDIVWVLDYRYAKKIFRAKPDSLSWYESKFDTEAWERSLKNISILIEYLNSHIDTILN